MSDEPRRTVLLTTSLPYVNGAPHLGHALEYVQTDAQARLFRLLGYDTCLVTGTDDNSLKNLLAAEREGVTVSELVERNAARFAALAAALGLSADVSVRTSTSAAHRDGVARIWEACARAGDLYERTYRGLYCVGCEQFYARDELTDGRCPEHETEPEVVAERNWFFRLSRYQRPLLELIDSGALRIAPASRAREARAVIAAGLEDISVSRPRDRARGWGLPVPGDPSQVVYVWFDALGGYLTALGDARRDAARAWTDARARVHVLGKGILRFHAVYWPAFLLSAGLPSPTELRVHGYLTVDGRKIGKSLGNGVDPSALVARYGAEALRYWLLRDVPVADDADFREERLALRYQTELANDLGNLVQRVLGLVHRYRGGVVPAPGAGAGALRGEPGALLASLRAALEQGFDPPAAVAAVWSRVTAANRYVDRAAPWALHRAEQGGDEGARRRLDAVLYELGDAVRVIGEALRPLLPATAEAILARLGVRDAAAPWPARLESGALPAGTRVAQADPLFPRR